MATKITRLKLVNFIGIHKALRTSEIEIDFSRTDKRIILFLGGNGCGKSTITSTLHPFMGNFNIRKNLILEGKDGRKEIDYIREDGVRFEIIHHYANGKNKSFITKIDPDGTRTDLNPAGTIRSFTPIVEEELGITENFFKLNRIGSQEDNFIDLESSKRKEFIGEFTPDVDEYFAAYKHATTKYSLTTKEIRYITDEMDKLPNKEAVLKTLNITKSAAALTENYIRKTKVDVGVIEAKLLEYDTANELAVLEAAKDSATNLLEEHSEDVDYDEFELDTVEEKINSREAALKKNRDQLSELSLERARLIQSAKNAKENIDNAKKSEAELLDDDHTSVNDIQEKIDTAEARLNTLGTLCKNTTLEKIRKAFNKGELSLEDADLALADNLLGNAVSTRSTECPATLDDWLEENAESLPEFSTACVLNEVESLIETEESNLTELKKRLALGEKELAVLEADIHAAHASKDLISLCSKGEDCCLYQKVQELTKASPESSTKKLKVEISKFREGIKAATANLEEYEEILEFIVSISRLVENASEEVIELVNDAINTTDVNEYQCADLESFIFFHSATSLLTVNKYVKDSLADVRLNKKIAHQLTLIDRLTRSLTAYTEVESQLLVYAKIVKEEQSKYVSAKAKEQTLNTEIMALENLIERIDKRIKELNELKDGKIRHTLLKKDLETATKNLDKFSKKNAKLIKEADTLSELNEKIDHEEALLEQHNKTIANQQMQLSRIEEFESRKDKLEIERVVIGAVKEAVDVKSGIPLYLVGDYLSAIRDATNSLLNIAYKGKFFIDFEISDRDFFITVYDNGEKSANDIRECSQGEISLVKTSLSLGIIAQAIRSLSKQYTIVSLDEIDAQLDEHNRLMFLDILEKQLDALNSEQCFVITHNDCFFTASVGLVLLPKHKAEVDDDDFMANKDIVFSF